MERIDGRETSFWDFRGKGDYTDKLFLIGSPLPMAVTLTIYLWFVLKFGPEFMKNRKPINLGKLLVIYNIVQVLISTYISSLGSDFLLRNGLWHSECLSEKNDLRIQIIDGSYYYFLSKMVELLDTVFFVLRKKQRQVSFLHVYHHTIMVIATWSIVKYNETDSVVFLGVINSLIHIVMYGYYGLSVFPAMAKYLWWKKYITILQLVQFSLMFLHASVSHAISECRPAHVLLFTVCSNTVLFMYLFGDFYIKAYLNKCKARDVAASKVSSNIECKNGIYLIDHHELARKIQ